MFNLKAIKVVEKSNVRGSSGERNVSSKFQFRCLRAKRKVNGSEELRTMFYFSSEKFNELGLEERGIIQLKSFDEQGNLSIGFAVVPEEDATIYKGRLNPDGTKSKKGLVINSNILEKDLTTAGVISDVMGNQFMNLTKIEGTEGYELPNGIVAVGGIYAVTKGEGEVKEGPKITKGQAEPSADIAPAPVAEEVMDFDDEEL